MTMACNSHGDEDDEEAHTLYSVNHGEVNVQWEVFNSIREHVDARHTKEHSWDGKLLPAHYDNKVWW